MWFTSDLHFFHRNVIKHCNRPFSDIKDMHEQLIDIGMELQIVTKELK
jgi:calcineurin-like phosphoesterase family protein